MKELFLNGIIGKALKCLLKKDEIEQDETPVIDGGGGAPSGDDDPIDDSGWEF